MNEILIIKPSSLGDIVHGLYVARAIKAQTPNAHISWVARRLFAPIVEASPYVDEVIVFERRKGLRGFWDIIRNLRRRQFDYVLDLQGLARSAVMTIAASGPMRIGRTDSREGAWISYTQKAPLPEGHPDCHAVDILLEFLPLLGMKKDTKGPLEFNPPKKPSSEDLKEIWKAKNAILLFPESRRPEKNWPYFQDLTDALLEACPERPVVWLGMNRDLAIRPEWSGKNFHNLLGKTSLADTLHLIKQSALVVSNDSGPVHIAAAMGKEVVGLYGPTELIKYGPYPAGAPTNHALEAPEQDLEQLRPVAVFEKAKAILEA